MVVGVFAVYPSVSYNNMSVLVHRSLHFCPITGLQISKRGITGIKGICI